MNIEFEDNIKDSIIYTIHLNKRTCMSYKWRNKDTVKVILIFNYFKEYIRHRVVIENTNSIITGNDMDYVLRMLDISNYKYGNNESSQENHRELLYEFDDLNVIILGKMKFNVITGVIRSYNVKLTMIFKNSFLLRSKTNSIKKK